MRLIKTFTITLTPKKQLLFGLPILVVAAFVLITHFALVSEHNKQKAIFERVLGHKIMVSGRLVSAMDRKGDLFLMARNQRNQMLYGCLVSTDEGKRLTELAMNIVEKQGRTLREGSLLTLIGFVEDYQFGEGEDGIMMSSCGVMTIGD